MQKISSYLYPNRVEVEFDRQSSITEWKIVYQRRLKIYQGITNTIEFDFKNSQQRRADLSGIDFNCAIMDQDGQVVTILPLEVTDKKGLAILTIPRQLLATIVPQFLTYSLYSEDIYGNKEIVYADTQFGANGTMELVQGAYPFLHQVTQFFEDANHMFYCHPIEFDMLDDQIIDLSHFRLNFELTDCNALVSVFASNDPVVDDNTTWLELETFEVNQNIPAISKEYIETRDFPNNLRWLQIRYDPLLNNTGTIDTVIIVA